ncbi:MAG: OsmC family protein [Microbacterium sp.]|uniref:OsmC family protein n=1 Tax=Microbacterium sp. TaxID=51671 RepID=UPI002611D47C|nr:OsmC family protein [Microbacterium sp.]MCX6502014.1 OsmC family protein [Microbacterium sp.]
MSTIAESVIPAVTAEERATRLTEAGAAWSERIDANRASAHLTYLVKGHSEGSVATRLTAGRHTILVDEPAPLAGDDVAASPVEVALAALISCQVVVYRLYAQALGIQIDDLQVTAEGDLDAARLFGKDDTVRAGFTDVRLRIEIAGPESAERYEELRRTVDAHCPVLDLFQNPTPVTTTVVVR